jgi:hypothetical protein
MADDVTRSAAKTSALIAAPLALVVGAIVFFSFYGRVNASATAKPAATAQSTVSTPVTMTAPVLPAAHAQACLAVIAALPTSIRGLAERHVTAGAQQNAAFGNPAITVACGAPKAAVAATGEVYTLSNVCWAEATTTTGTLWTTVDREVPIAVTIPAQYTSPGTWAIEFSPMIVQGMPAIKTPYNC